MTNKTDNIFFSDFKTTRGYVPFDRISKKDYEPAIMHGIAVHEQEVAAIVSQTDEPTFENTIVALERSGAMLSRVLGVFYPMLSAMSDDEMMEISNRIAPAISEHYNNINLNHDLWLRVKSVYDHFDRNRYDQEDWMLMKGTYLAFERNGATLEGEEKEKLRTLAKQLTQLSLKFEQNHLKETNKHQLWLSKDDLEGLPERVVEAAAQAAKEKGREGEYLVTLHAPSYMPFMKYSKRRDLRQKLYTLFNSQCTDGEFSNMQLVKDIANTRLKIANLLGHKNFALYRLQNSMAQTPENVMDMLNKLKQAYREPAKREMSELKAFADKMEGTSVDLKPWDYSYYAYNMRQALFHYSDEDLRPYFKLENVAQGVFSLATRLYGLHFTENHDVQVFHPDVHAYDVTDGQGSYVGTIYTDFFPRETKHSGAWMTNFREQWTDACGNNIRPFVTLTMNFTRPTETQPSLLTFGEVNTFVHEFGHGLHSLLSQCKYVSTSGTNVYRDFVELPSQFHENFLREREFLDSFARHYITGEKIPDELLDKLLSAQQFGAAYACMRQLGFGYLDMAWHTISEPYEGDTAAFETQATAEVSVFAPVDGCLTSSHFGHIFSGGYAAGYYGYKWAEVLDSDAFALFQEKGVFNPEVAQHMKDCILSRGSSDEPSELYRRFRGRDPQIDALLRRDGIK